MPEPPVCGCAPPCEPLPTVVQAEVEEADRRGDLLVIGCPPDGQVLEFGALDINTLGMADIAATDDLVNEAAIGCEVVEVSGFPHQQRVIDRPLEMAVRAFDGPVLVGDAGIVAGRRHAVVDDEFLVARRQVRAGIFVQITECRRQAVTAVLARNPAERPERVLQAFGERDEALAAKDDMSMFEAGIGEPEVIETMVERLTGDGDAGATRSTAITRR